MIYKINFGACRDIGHAWEYLEWRARERVLECASCGATKKQVFNNGSVKTKGYKYLKGYQCRGGFDRGILKELREALQGSGLRRAKREKTN